MPVNSRAKGSRFELELAKTISIWWCQDESLKDKRADELPFRRAPLSGGWDKKAAAADLIVTDPTKLPYPWPLSVEAKDREEWDFSQMWNPGWAVKAYWDQCSIAAKATNQIPLVLFTKKRQQVFFALPAHMPFHLGIPAIDFSWLPFSVGRFDDLLKLTPQQIVAKLEAMKDHGHKQLSASSQQAKGGAKPVANPVKERPRETGSEEPASRVLGGDPKVQESKIFPGYVLHVPILPYIEGPEAAAADRLLNSYWDKKTRRPILPKPVKD